jgi:DNA-binding response OmpR family regulator
MSGAAAMPARILIVEDQRALREQLSAVLLAAGFEVETAADGNTGLLLALEQSPDLLLLDIGLPGLGGLAVCAALRERADRHVPVLMLTARDTLDDKIKGFEAGTDDYLVKPFANAELVARCRALLHRHRLAQAQIVAIGSLRFDRLAQQFERNGRRLQLPRRAGQILQALVDAWPRALSRSALIDRLWPDEVPPSDPLRSHLYVLRQQLDGEGEAPMLITVHGVGFRLDGNA